MHNRDDLAEVYYDLPRLPMLGLIDGVLAVLAAGDPASLQSVRDELALERARPAQLCPEDLLEPLLHIIDRSHPNRPIEWHIQRALHVVDHHFEPRLSPDANDTVRRHRVLLERIAGDASQEFLYVGLRVNRLPAPVLAHLRDWAPTDPEVAACLARSPFLDPGALEPELVGAAATCVLVTACAEGTRDADDPTTVTILKPSERTDQLVRWAGQMLRRAPGFLPHVRMSDAPLRIRLGEPPDTGMRDLGLVFDVRRISLPDDVEEATRLVLAIVQAHPQTAASLPYALAHRTAPPSRDVLCALAAVSPAFLAAAIQNGWAEGLLGAAEVLDSAEAADEYTRVEALVAIGAPAAEALAQVVDERLRRLADESDPQRAAHGYGLASIADRASLPLKFWEARLGRPGAFSYLWASARIREALHVRPEPVYRLLRRAAERDEQRSLGIEILGELEGAPLFPLGPAADAVVCLLRSEVHGIAPYERFRLLARAGSAEALELLVHFGADDDVDVDALVLEAAVFDEVWAALEGPGYVQPRWLVEPLVQDRRRIGERAAQGVTDVLLQRSRSMAEPKLRSLLADLVAHHRAALGADRYKAALTALEPHVDPDLLQELRVPLPKPVAELPWQHLSESDLGQLLPQLGEWFAARVTEKEWMRVDVGKVFRPAVRARFCDALGDHGAEVVAALGERWPTRALVEEIASERGISVPSEALDRCSDEAVPPVFRAVLARLPVTIEGRWESPYSDEHWLVRWVLQEVWVDSPELVARHTLTVFKAASHPEWRRGLALALVSLREPCGTSVPDALTRASHTAQTPEEAEFYRKQRDTFARSSAEREQDLPGETRTRGALDRIVRFARRARGVA